MISGIGVMSLFALFAEEQQMDLRTVPRLREFWITPEVDDRMTNDAGSGTSERFR